MKHPIAMLLLFTVIISCHSTEDPLENAQARYPMLKPCLLDDSDEEILCGTIHVFEDQFNKAGRKIPLNIFLFPAKDKNPSSSVFVEYNGGPGVPNNLFLSYYEKGGYSHYLRELRDVLVIEKRGTGASRISCAALDSISLFLDYYLFNPDLIADCLQEIQNEVDLSKYGTAAQVEDIEEIREWLGVEHFDFHGISYGTRVALELIRKYPDAVNSGILTGSVPPNFGLFKFVDAEIERVLNNLLQRCKRDSTCHSNFPNFKEELYETKETLKAQSVNYEYIQEKSNKKYSIEITSDVFTGMVVKLFFSGTKIEQLPALIHDAYLGNFSPLIESNIASYKLEIPLHLSQFCAEEANGYSQDDFASMDNLFSNGIGALMEFRACQVWEKLPMPKWLSSSIGGETPLLLFSGEDDVLTPPRMNDSIQLFFPNSKHVIFKGQGHSYTDWSCWDNLVYQFLEHEGDLHQLDVSCVKEISRPGFPK